jgi:hypothetical protein
MVTLSTALAKATLCTVDGIWQRHVLAAHSSTALAGRAAMGRWGTAGGYLVLYLGRPEDSVVVEAYRHLIDPVVDDQGRMPPPMTSGITASLRPRRQRWAKPSRSSWMCCRQASGRFASRRKRGPNFPQILEKGPRVNDLDVPDDAKLLIAPSERAVISTPGFMA